MKLSVVIPVYNEEATIHEIMSRVRAAPLPAVEIVIVDDCSTELTRQLLAELPQTADIKVILQNRNRRKGAALRTGFAAATGDVIVIRDADLEYDRRSIPSRSGPSRRTSRLGLRFTVCRRREPSGLVLLTL